MAVIVTGMEMPESCSVCPLHTEYMSNIICGKTGSKIGITCACYERMKDCPLKSVEGLIEKIKTDMSRFMYDDYGNTTTEHDVLVGIIREYCGLEESNG